jgi:hypothetical protein
MICVQGKPEWRGRESNAISYKCLVWKLWYAPSGNARRIISAWTIHANHHQRKNYFSLLLLYIKHMLLLPNVQTYFQNMEMTSHSSLQSGLTWFWFPLLIIPAPLPDIPGTSRIVFWETMPCSQFKANRCFGGICRLHLRGPKINQTVNQHEGDIKLIFQSWRWRQHVQQEYDGWLSTDNMELYPRNFNSS